MRKSATRFGMEFTFSEPRSVCVYLALSRDAEWERAVREALRQMLTCLEEELC